MLYIYIAAATATTSDLSTATTFTVDLTTAITTASIIIFTATDHTSSTHCEKHNKSPFLCTSSGCQEVLETRRRRRWRRWGYNIPTDPVAQCKVTLYKNEQHYIFFDYHYLISIKQNSRKRTEQLQVRFFYKCWSIYCYYWSYIYYYCQKHNNSPSSCTSSGCQVVLARRAMLWLRRWIWGILSSISMANFQRQFLALSTSIKEGMLRSNVKWTLLCYHISYLVHWLSYRFKLLLIRFKLSFL